MTERPQDRELECRSNPVTPPKVSLPKKESSSQGQRGRKLFNLLRKSSEMDGADNTVLLARFYSHPPEKDESKDQALGSRTHRWIL
ncbi:hypothetical protein F2Q69_00046465 [Brassica cretica]|uniref:Uncharacterized protein n=1 Tax=Brassica cretica TaxID=69181 RepID=A0A8S9PIW7_BRACR|nr:hypothetical protein F2Q69_00046465 [Brassica cretica]